MPLLDIVNPQPSFRNPLYSVRFNRVYHASFLFSKENTTRLGSSQRHVCIPNKAHNIVNTGSFVTRRGCGLMIKAVVTLEPRPSDKENDNVQQLDIDSSEDSTVNEKKRLIRMKISKAMKGKTPWNKGRKHSPETLQRIRERTKIAMQDPKIRMKVAVNLGQALSEETKMKIKAGVRLHLERLHEKQMVQEACHFEWRNLIAEASRKGFCGEELQWDSYEIINKQLDKEWIESIEHRKKNRPKGFKRGPLSPEQKRKLSRILSAKWVADPSYRDRVYTGLSKYYGKTVGTGKAKTRERNPDRPLIAEAKRSVNAEEIAGAQPSITETRKPNPDSQVKSKVITKTKPLMAENKRVAGMDPIAQASVIEPRRTKPENQVKSRAIKKTKPLIAEAMREETAGAKDPIAQPLVIETRETNPESQVKREAIERTKLLVAEARRVVAAREIAAAKDPIAQAQVIETRKLIAKAVRFIESMEAGQSKMATYHEHGLATSSNDLDLIPPPHTSNKTKGWVRGKLVEDG